MNTTTKKEACESAVPIFERVCIAVPVVAALLVTYGFAVTVDLFHGQTLCEQNIHDRASFIEHFNRGHAEYASNIWYEQSELHITGMWGVSIPNKAITDWQESIAAARSGRIEDPEDACFYRKMSELFDTLHVHTRDKLEQMNPVSMTTL